MSGNRLCAHAFFILILSIGTSYGDVNNILVNPGFENSTTGNWVARGGAFSRVTSPVHSGSRSGRAYSRTNTWNGIQQSVLNKMVIGQTYQVSGWVRTASPSATVQLTFEKTDGSGTGWAQGARGTANNSTWTYISGTYTLTATGTLTALNFYVESLDLNDVYLDDANVFGQAPGTPPPTDPNATGQVNFNVTHQTLEGFGGAGSWYQNYVTTYGSSHPEIYNILFRDLGIDIYRIRNTYNIDSSYITQTAQIIAGGEAALGHPLRVMNTSWSPPASLKSNGNSSQGTLAKDANGNYRYADFAQWWADSLTAWSNAGVNSYYLNMQNEPGYQNSGWDTCQLNPTEDSSYAGYEQAFAALCTKLNSLPSRPLLLAPEGQDTTSTPSYVNALTVADKANVYGYSHHLYNGSADNPDGLIGPMTTLKAAIGGDNKPLLQTEFSGGTTTTWTNAMNLAILIHNAMTVEEASAYLYWDLFWTSPSGLVTVSNTSYTINPVYYAMMHYSRFTDPNWQRVDANSNSSALRISAYKDPCEPNASIVIINTSTTTDINLTLALTGFTPQNSGIYQSKSGVNCAYIGTFSTSTPVFLPKQSITTIHLAGFADCASVQAYGYRLSSDLNGDCYVDSLDLGVIAGEWLHADCTTPGNCQNADFAPTDGTVDFLDFGDFGPQWMQCNDPEDPYCTPNW